MALPLQSRLLRVLAEGEVQPVGALAPRKVDLRVVSASHRSLTSLVEEGRFREDLFYRLSAATLRLPPLRERSDFGWILDRLLVRHGLDQDGRRSRWR
jgi:transcriptional regulator of acetoin/glycerol metabolism